MLAHVLYPIPCSNPEELLPWLKILRKELRQLAPTTGVREILPSERQAAQREASKTRRRENQSGESKDKSGPLFGLFSKLSSIATGVDTKVFSD